MRGKRLSWQYNVTYANGDVRIFEVPCPSVPVLLNSEIINERLEFLREQPLRCDFLDKLEESRTNVFRCLQGLINIL